MEEEGRDVWLPRRLLWRHKVQQHLGHESFVEEQGHVKLQEQERKREQEQEVVVFCRKSLPLSF